MDFIFTNYLKNLNRIKCRRPLHKNQNKKSLIIISIFGIIFALLFFLCLLNWQKIRNFQINSKADNQYLNWMNAENIYEFKIQKLDESYLYLSELKNKVLLIVK
jgi:hypothetical protein